MGVNTKGILTAEILEAGMKKLLENSFAPHPAILVSPKMIQRLIEWEAREREWKKLGPLGYKMARLKWDLKHKKRDNKVLPLPE